MTSIEMKLVKMTANFALYKCEAGDEKGSFGTIYVAKRDLPSPVPDRVTVTVGDSVEMALWQEAERMKGETT